MSAIGAIGEGAQGFGAILQMVSSYYQAAAQKGALRSAAMSAEFDASIASINARAAEREANSIMLAGQQQQAIVSARYGQQRGSFIAQTGARGVRQTGSAAEIRASIQAAKELDLLALRQGTAAAAESSRSRAVDQQNRALLARTSAGNIRRTAGSIKPWESVLSSLVGSSGTLAQSWRYQERSES